MPLASSPRGGHPEELQGTANLILVLEAQATAHNTAPGARLRDGLTRPSEHDVNGRPRLHFHAAPALPDRGGSGLRGRAGLVGAAASALAGASVTWQQHEYGLGRHLGSGPRSGSACLAAVQ